MSTFLQLTQQFYREIGFSGAVPSAVTGQTNVKRKSADWVAEAEYLINSKWSDWNYLWTQWSRATVVGTANYAAPADIANWDLDSVYLNRTTDAFQQLDYITYKEWREQYRNGTKTNAVPDMFTILPDNSMTLESPPVAIYTLTADYWKTPTKLTADANTSPIPVRFERIIIARAKMIYAEHFKDQGMLQSAGGEYGELLDRLEADQLPERGDRMSQAGDFTMVVE